MNAQDKPSYMSQAVLARRFGVTNTAVSNWISRWPWNGDVLPIPEPDAFVEDRPLWLESSFPKWEAWRAARRGAAMDGRAEKRIAKKGSWKRQAAVNKVVVVGVNPEEAEANRVALHRLLWELYAAAGWPAHGDLAARSGLSASSISAALKTAQLPARQTLIDLVTALRGNPEEALALWARARPSRSIDGGWLSRILSVVHGEVLRLAAVGTSLEDTAATLGWTLQGVRDYWDDITERLRVQSMDEAVWVAFEAGYLRTQADGSIVHFQRSGGPDKKGGDHGYLIYQVAHELREQLAELPPGTVLPTIDAMRAERRTSSTTMSFALKLLKAEGLITGGGKGHPFVVADRGQR